MEETKKDIYRCSNDLLSDARHIIDTTKQYAFRSIDIALLQHNWHLGRRISEEPLHGEQRADYGKEIIKEALCAALSARGVSAVQAGGVQEGRTACWGLP